MQLKTALGGDRCTHLAQSSDISISTLPYAAAAWVDFVFPTPVTVTAGQLYYAEIQGTVWDSGSLASISWGNGVSYADGGGYQKSSGVWGGLAWPLAFRSYVGSQLDLTIASADTSYFDMSGGALQIMTMHAWDRLTGGLPSVGTVDDEANIPKSGGGFQYNGDDLSIHWTATAGLDHYYDQAGWIQIQVDNYSTSWSVGPSTNLMTDQFGVTFTHRFSAVTDANGAYSFPDLPDGSYVVTFEKSAFDTQTACGD